MSRPASRAAGRKLKQKPAEGAFLTNPMCKCMDGWMPDVGAGMAVMAGAEHEPRSSNLPRRLARPGGR